MSILRKITYWVLNNKVSYQNNKDIKYNIWIQNECRFFYFNLNQHYASHSNFRHRFPLGRFHRLKGRAIALIGYDVNDKSSN